MTTKKEIIIKDIINSKAADDDEKGNKVLDKIKELSNNDENDIILNFTEIELVNTAFLNNAIGQLFNKKEFDLSKNNVKLKNIDQEVLDLVKETISLARMRYGTM